MRPFSACSIISVNAGPAKFVPNQPSSMNTRVFRKPFSCAYFSRMVCWELLCTLPFPPNVVLFLPRNLTAASPCSLPAGEVITRSYPIRTVIQFSICLSIGRQQEGAEINPLCKFFEWCLQRQKEPVHSTSNQREMISRYIFDETMYRLCYSETFNACYFRSAGRLSTRSGTFCAAPGLISCIAPVQSAS